MKKILSLLLVTFFSLSALAQTGIPSSPGAERKTEKGNGKISGAVLDSATQKPVEYATVALYRKGADQPFDGTVCDDKGKFTLNKIDDGEYTVAVSFIGFQTKKINVSLSDKKNDVELGNISIAAETAVLKEVTVEAQRALVEERVDRTIYNAENDATTKGGDATDVLRRVPMLSVDMDGNVSLRGNQNIQVLINNKPSSVIASSVADALKQIPADQIKTVEVITSPSAKYDAEGSSGIINIITKKNTLQGLTLNIDAGAGYRGSNLGLNGNYRIKKMGFSLGGHGRAQYNTNGSFENNQTTKGYIENDEVVLFVNPITNIQSADTRNRGLFGNYNLGWDYDINPKNVLAASVRFGIRNGTNFQDNLLTQTGSASRLADVETKDHSNNVDASLTYTHLYAKPQRELSIQTLYSRNNRQNDFENIGRESFKTKNVNDSYNQEMTVQVDYQSPLNSNQMVEFGGKNIWRRAVSDFSTFSATTSDGEYVEVEGTNLNNNLNYDQNVSSAYGSYTYTTKNGYSFKGGTRYEYTTIKAYTQTETDIEIPAYGVIVPSLNASRRFKNGKTVKASYNRRIQRPSIRFLNPNQQASNPLIVTEGNERLSPEYTNNFELGYSTFVKGTSLNFTGFFRNTNNSIQSIRQPNDDVPGGIKITYANIGEENAYGASFFANINIGKVTLNGGGDVFYTTLTNNNPIPAYSASNEGWVYNGRVMGSYNLGKGWMAQAFSGFRGQQVQLQGTQGAMRFYAAGFRKEFNEKRGTIGFGAENFLQSSLKIRNTTETPLITQKSINTINNLSFRVNFSYRIGKMSMDQRPPRRTRSINNDDLKEGGGDGTGQMDGAAIQPQQSQRGGGGMPSGQRPANTPNVQKQTPPADPTAEVKAEGTWNYTVQSPQPGEGVLTIRKEGDKYAGTVFSKRANREIALTNVTLNGNELTFAYDMTMGPNQVTITGKVIINGDAFTGNMAFGQMATFPVEGKRAQ